MERLLQGKDISLMFGVRGSLNKFSDFFRIDSTHMKI